MDGWVNIAVRFALYLDLMLLFGVPLFGLYALRRHERHSTYVVRPLRALLVALVGIGMALSACSMIVMGKAMTGASDYVSIGTHALSMLISGTAFGAAWLVRVAALAACLAATLALASRPTTALGVATVSGGIALITLAWGGHGVMNDGDKGVLHLTSDVFHLMAGAGWVGALTAFGGLLRVDQSTPQARIALLSRTLNSFAVVGATIVVTLVATGLINYGMIVGPTLRGLLTTAYGQLLVIKLALFGLMLGLAAANRYHLAPLLEIRVQSGDYQGALSALRRSLFIETNAATAILAVVAALGTLSPE